MQRSVMSATPFGVYHGSLRRRRNGDQKALIAETEEEPDSCKWPLCIPSVWSSEVNDIREITKDLSLSTFVYASAHFGRQCLRGLCCPAR
jgi:hypothetical protein